MEYKKISELALLKIQNCNLRLRILELQAQQLISERDSLIKTELSKLGCSHPEDWRVNDITGEVTYVGPNTKGV